MVGPLGAQLVVFLTAAALGTEDVELRGSSVLNERARIVLFLLSYRMAIHPCKLPYQHKRHTAPPGSTALLLGDHFTRLNSVKVSLASQVSSCTV